MEKSVLLLPPMRKSAGGPHKFDVDAFGAQFAYTVDGGPLGELEYESFNAASAKNPDQRDEYSPWYG